MNIKNKQVLSNVDISNIVKEKIQNADAVVIGAGSGLSAAAGLNYVDEEFFVREYTPFLKKGYKTVWEGITDNWSVNEKNALVYWGYWANHINNIYYKPNELETYRQLYDVIKEKDYFVITTNGDGQFFKGDFERDRIFAMQGSYGWFQCQKNCNDTVYDNKEMVEAMLKGFDEQSLLIREQDVPRCPDCGGLLCPNLRVDGNFVEGPNMKNSDAYAEFIQENYYKNILFLELGVGFNTPGIIRFPFEQMTYSANNACLIRVNNSYPEVSKEIAQKSLGTSIDLGELIKSVS